MDALISGQAGIAVLIDDDNVFSITLDSGNEMKPCSLSMVPYLFSGVSDAKIIKQITLSETVSQLKVLWQKDRALHLTLILLDSHEELQIRKLAVASLFNLLVNQNIYDFVEKNLYALPLPASSDLLGSIQLIEEDCNLKILFHEIHSNQIYIDICSNAWDKLPTDLFDEICNKNKYRLLMVNENIFKLVVKEISKSNYFNYNTIINQCNHIQNFQNIIKLWFRTAKEITDETISKKEHAISNELPIDNKKPINLTNITDKPLITNESEVIKLGIADDNVEFCQLLQDFFELESKIDLALTVHNGAELIEVIPQVKLDVLLLDMIMPQVDGLGVLQWFKDHPQYPKPKIIIFSAFGQEEITKNALRLGVDYYVLKPFDLGFLTQRIIEVTKKIEYKSILLRKVFVNKDLEKEVADAILSLQIPPFFKGFVYLRDAIMLTVQDPNLIKEITKKLYPIIAGRYNTTIYRVERAMRFAIEKAWNKGNVELLHQLFGYCVDGKKGKPTNASFIVKIADQIRLKRNSNVG
jgi:two-component system response regulator (stage 0 sporulation protein A)